MKKSPIEQTNDNLKIVPYYVMKNPSEPSLIGSATSCIAFVPALLSRICPKSQILNTINATEITNAVKPIRFAVLFEMMIAKTRIDPGIAASAPNFTGTISFDSIL